MNDDQLITFHHPRQVDPEVLKILDRRLAYFGKLNEHGFGAIYPLIKEWKCDYAKGYNSFSGGRKSSTIITEIADISFPCLISLELDSNDISSVESLSRMSMPSLAIANLCTSPAIKPSTASAESGV